MRTQVVVVAAKAVEEALLAADAGGRRARRLRFEFAVDPLVPAILFGMAGRVEFGDDAQLDPPDVQARQRWRA